MDIYREHHDECVLLFRIIWIRLQEEDINHPFQQHIKAAKERLTQSSDYLPYEAAENILEKIFGENNSNQN